MPSGDSYQPREHTVNNDATVPTDAELFELFQRGNDAGFETLFARYGESVYTFCFRMMCDSDRADDAFQETFMCVVRFRDSFNRAKPFHAWLFAIARNCCLTILRRDKFFETLDDVADDESLIAWEDPLDITERDMINEALAQLPLQSREALLLYEYEGFSYEEIAEMTGRGLSSVKVRIHRARKTLRATLGRWLDHKNG